MIFTNTADFSKLPHRERLLLMLCTLLEGISLHCREVSVEPDPLLKQLLWMSLLPWLSSWGSRLNLHLSFYLSVWKHITGFPPPRNLSPGNSTIPFNHLKHEIFLILQQLNIKKNNVTFLTLSISWNSSSNFVPSAPLIFSLNNCKKINLTHTQKRYCYLITEQISLRVTEIYSRSENSQHPF